MGWRVLIVGGPDAGRAFEVPEAGKLQIGRGANSDTKIRDPKLSRIHCSLRCDGGRLLLSDLGSLSGTFRSEQRLESEVALKADEEFAAGASRFRVESSDPLDAKTEGGTVTSWQRPSGIEKTVDQLTGTMFQRFRVDKRVAVGTSSVVYRGWDTRRERVVALKILMPSMTNKTSQRDRFVRAMRTMLPVRHPHLVRLYKAGVQGDHCWAALEWVEGCSATALIQQIGVGGVLEWREVWRVGVHVARALVEASRRQIVHRNVTPSNILRREEDHAYLLNDLVFARALDASDATPLTRAGDIFGELAYLAPERVTNPTELDPRSDFYSLGATLFALLMGKRPPPAIGGDSLAGKPAIAMNTKLRGSVNEKFLDLVAELLSPKPEQRPENAVALLRALDRVGKFGGVDADWSAWV
jgi:eukaryotic-like serine/threonine-protein kinase